MLIEEPINRACSRRLKKKISTIEHLTEEKTIKSKVNILSCC